MEIDQDKWKRIKELFEAARKEKPSRRLSFLAQSCPEEELRLFLEKMLLYDEKPVDFLSNPYPNIAALVQETADESTFKEGQLLTDRFQISHFIAKGGMGEVYEALDLELQTSVAIKTMRPEFLVNLRTLERFKREVQLAKQVTHQNVCRVFDLFRNRDPELFFISMELLKGETLAERLQRDRRMSTTQALPIISQMALALAAAHAAGVVHRDFKPGNVVLVPMPDKRTRAVVTDFGLAFSELEAADERLSLGDSPMLWGTPTYMSPEQLKGHEATSASDIYALGLVIYEMVTGTRPLEGKTPFSTALRRLSEAPLPPHEIVAELDPQCETVILTCLERQPEKRFSAQEIIELLPRQDRTSAHPTFAWKTHLARHLHRFAFKRWSLTSLVIAIAVVSITFFVHRNKASTSRDHNTIVVADFVNTTGASIFDFGLRQAVQEKLKQSPFFSLIPNYKITMALSYMGHAPGDRLTEDLAMQICVRTRGKALILGSISTVGTAGRYKVGLKAVACANNKNLANEEVEVGDRETVLQALDRATDSIRRQLREPLDSISAFDIHIDDVTTASLDALDLFSRGEVLVNKKEPGDALALFTQAIDKDRNFAFAYARRGTIYGNLGESAKATADLQKAFELRDRVSQWEKFYIESHYYAFVTGELQKEVHTYEEWKKRYPSDTAWRINLGVDYGLIGEYDKAIAEESEAIAETPELSFPYANLTQYYINKDRFDEANAILERARAAKLDDLSLRLDSYQLAFLQDRPSAMKEAVDAATNKVGMEDALLSTHADTFAYYGQISRSRPLAQKAAQSAYKAGATESAASCLVDNSLWDAEFGNKDAALNALRRAFSGDMLESAKAWKDVQKLTALVLARAGAVWEASRLLSDLKTRFPNDSVLNLYWLPTIQAAIYLNSGKPDQALDVLASNSPYETGAISLQCMYPAFLRGEAYLKLKNGAAGAAEFRRILNHRGLLGNCPLGSLARLGLARSLVLKGDVSASRVEYQNFLNLWKDADQDLPIYRDARSEYEALKPVPNSQ